MNDSSDRIAALVAERHRRMSPEERMAIASAMFDAARAIVESSLSSGLTEHERRLAWARRLYGKELPEAALLAFANATAHRGAE